MSAPRWPSADCRRLVRELEDMGCVVSRAGNGHIWIKHSNAGFLSIASSPSSWRFERYKALSWLRRGARRAAA